MVAINEWLAEDNHRIILIDMQYHNGTALQELNISSHPYTLRNGDKFINSLGVEVTDVYYDDIIAEIPSIVTKIDASVSFGNIILNNADGEYDWLVGDINIFEGHRIKVYLGDPSWFRSSFINILDGVIESITAPDISTLSISIRDKRQELELDLQNKIITDDPLDTNNIPDLVSSSNVFTRDILYEDGTVYNTWPQSVVVPESSLGKDMPILFGKCFNIEPILVDSANHVFMVSSEPITEVSEVRSNGVVLDPNTQYEVDTQIGCIRLLNHDRGTQITCDAQGITTRHSSANLVYSLPSSSVSLIIEWILLDKTSFSSSDICYDSFVGLNNSVVGLYINKDYTISQAINELASSIGAYLRFNKLGINSTCTIELQQLYLPTDTNAPPPALDVNADTIVKNGLSIISIEQPMSKLTLGYKKNWTQQDKGNLAGVITTDDNLQLVDAYASEYSKVFATNDILSVYPLAESSELIETLLYNKSDAQDEVNRRALIRSKKRYVYQIDSVASPFVLNVGDIINLKHIRYDFTGRTNPQNTLEQVTGKNCLIIGLTEQPTKKRVIMEVWL